MLECAHPAGYHNYPSRTSLGTPLRSLETSLSAAAPPEFKPRWRPSQVCPYNKLLNLEMLATRVDRSISNEDRSLQIAGHGDKNFHTCRGAFNRVAAQWKITDDQKTFCMPYRFTEDARARRASYNI